MPIHIPVQKIADNDASDGYHTFDELYEFRKLYNAAFVNALYQKEKYDGVPIHSIHKSKRHSDGELCFGGGWFIVKVDLPDGQISNHYEIKDWDLFDIPERDISDEWDGHTPDDVVRRLRNYILKDYIHG